MPGVQPDGSPLIPSEWRNDLGDLLPLARRSTHARKRLLNEACIRMLERWVAVILTNEVGCHPEPTAQRQQGRVYAGFTT